MNQPLITKYRPASFDEVMGHEAQMAALSKALASDSAPRAFLMTGPAGTGKTSIARIIAIDVHADVLEIDAAGNNGVDAMRELVEVGNHMSMAGSGRRMFIIDECHALSKPAWQVLLKILEEPPEHLFIALCTTELAKVPETIVTRCFHIALKRLSTPDMIAYASAIAELEGWEVNNDVLAAVVQAATGQPRKLLSLLQVAHDLPNKREVDRALDVMSDSENGPIGDLCRQVIAGKGWAVVGPIMAKIDDDEFANANIAIGRYLCGAMARASTPQDAQKSWELLDALMFPSASFDPKATFFAAVGRMLFAKG